MKTENLISIIGAGPAGISAAIQLKRYGYEPLLFEKDRVGGLLWNANLIENYPGFPKGISGPKLIRLMEKQLINYQINVKYQYIDLIRKGHGYYSLLDGNNEFLSKYLVIASGTKPKPIPFTIPEEIADNVHQDIVNLLAIEGKKIVIIGGGDAAFDYAINLSKKNKVSIIIRGEIQSIPLLVERAINNPAISVVKNTSLEEIGTWLSSEIDPGKTIEVKLISKNRHIVRMECNELVFALGREPRTEFCGDISEDEHCFFVGDVRNGIYRQASIAIGDGIMAAMKIHNIISSGVR
jgi:thioredoxin reductase